ncbi:MAG: DUF2268 domain-containing protein [Eubacteriales bacterium]|nr:DUF2268 domain-containing protein [Eubacteriales bacterium]
MKIERVYSAGIYRKIMDAEPSQKKEIYRYDMMMPFKGKWDCYHIPMKAEKPGGYDILMAGDMLGFLPPEKIGESCRKWIETIDDEGLWNQWEKTIRTALERFEKKGIALPVQEYKYSVLLANPENPYISLCDGYSGDGGIPGYIMGWMIPSEETIRRMPAALAHETNHNVRYQFIRWSNDVTLGEMLVSEGLAENYAVSMYGEELLGPWVTKTDKELMPLIKEIMFEALGVQGFDNITSYLYGDEMARRQGFIEVGVPYCAGYATGYYMIKYFLQKTGLDIEKATILPAGEILKEVTEFWTEDI